MKYYISIHDVRPDNIDAIKNIKQLLNNQYNIHKICLLVIPGCKWNHIQIEQLKKWQSDHCQIAAHGWEHVSDNKKSLYHLLHALIISGNSAEHLSKHSWDILNLMKKSYDWFVSNGFTPPRLYVPPAWALGKIKTEDLLNLPFKNFECTTGVLHKGKYKFLPLVGFIATSQARAYLQKFFNFLNFQMAKMIGVIRISIHPEDFDHYLSNDANKYLSRIKETILLHEII